MNPSDIVKYKIQTPLGPAQFEILNDEEVLSFDWNSSSRSRENIQSSQLAIEVLNQVNSYFNGDLKKFDLPLQIQGTEFQKIVWQALTKIPYGKTASYQTLGQKVGFEKSARAVGGAVGNNPLCLFIPCHRIIRSSGDLGGFSAGLERKKALLNLERKIQGI
jgi:methylated-DNA-[protein]-cysteine S-methyltransferase